ncbi:putative aldouronate transport system permease protein [Paenibacillus sp. UNCCL117]|uniref:carbohydrate ABC transporter permease n=1 Tax=unclassified Paenibacillus TaxID=185978 RepID=UPI00088A770A|nr:MULTISPECIES: carbohydrate ABC transporter permease [unclassified Paenibacillus]SDE46270.1 putative aldouronate transport system permease protein [Paenibacillus sp. cl123]SFW65887.1 putative aldouronate transport system permease protein [Paenibacillus sp. UNCCL117]
MRESTGDRIFYAINYALLTLAALTCLFPLLNVLALSLSDPSAVMAGQVTVFPIRVQWDSYEQLIKGTNVVKAFQNSLVIAVVGTLLCMLFTVLAAYPLSKRYFLGRRTLTLAIVFTMVFSGGLIPTYLVIKSIGLVNSYGALWLPALVSAYNMLILKTFFEGLPEELIEASRMDGCGELRLLTRIVLPLSGPVLATLTLFYGVGFWNSFMNVLIYINDSHKINLTVMVQQMISSQMLEDTITLRKDEMEQLTTPEGLKAAAIMILIIPMLVVYPFIQKYFVKGVMIGSIKG